MSKTPPGAGEVVVAQVVCPVANIAAALWLLDHELRYVTFIPKAKECVVGDIVFCRFSSEGKIDRMIKAGKKTHAEYAEKAFDFSNV